MNRPYASTPQVPAHTPTRRPDPTTRTPGPAASTAGQIAGTPGPAASTAGPITSTPDPAAGTPDPIAATAGPAVRRAGDTLRRPSGRCAVSRSDRGSATLELAVLAPGLLLLIALIALAGRYAIADGAVDHAAAEAARAASLQRTPSAGVDAATAVAKAALADQGLSCQHTDIDVDVAGLRAPPGHRGSVTVTVRCPLRVADLPLHVPAITLTATAVSPVDTYRER